ncbi:MAG TPA: glycosyltransferase family 2 protein [Sphingomicrobium sp.]|nr:glycosyltransferase family 2 protein [Sphingomicrobium sp.]
MIDVPVAAVIVNYRTPELIEKCLAALSGERALLPGLKAVVVDGASDDGSAERLSKHVAGPEYSAWVSFLPLPINGGFAWANNEAIGRLLQQPEPPQFIYVLNPDTEVQRGAAQALATYLLGHPRVGAVGSQLLDADGSLTGSAFRFPTLRDEFSRGARTGLVDRILKVSPIAIEASEAREVDWATGASVMLRSDALREVGLFDEGFFLYHEDIELMWRFRKAGWGVVFEPASRVRHVGGAATGVHSRGSPQPVQPRRPRYWYRSRARLFALSRGRASAMLAYAAWFGGYSIWALRRATGLGGGAKPFSHQFRDHARYALPRHSDGIPAVRAWNEPSHQPAWMERGWL